MSSADNDPCSLSLAMLSSTIEKKAKPEEIKKAFVDSLAEIEKLADFQRREQKAGDLVAVIINNDTPELMAIIYNDLPRLVNTELYGKYVAYKVLTLLRKNGEFRFIKLTNHFGLKGKRTGDFYCFYNAPLNLAIKQVCEEFESKGLIEKQSAKALCSSARYAYKRNISLILLDGNKQTLIRIFYGVADIELKKAVIECMLLVFDYEQGYILADLLSEKDQFAGNIYKKAIPPEFRGKTHHNYQADSDEN